MTNNSLIRFAVAIAATFALCSANAANPIKELDPCTKAKRQLEDAIEKERAELRSTLSKTENIHVDRAKAEELWNTAAAEKAVVRIRDGYKEAALTETQIAKMAAKEVSDYKSRLAPKEYEEQLTIILRQAAKPDIATAEEQFLADANAERAALNAACGNGEIEKATRIAGAFLQKRWDSMRTEQTPWNKVIKFTTDISMRDFERYGLLGGPNSDARKVVATVQREVGKVMDNNLKLSPQQTRVSDVTFRTPLGGRNAALPKAARDVKKFLRKPFG